MMYVSIGGPFHAIAFFSGFPNVYCEHVKDDVKETGFFFISNVSNVKSCNVTGQVYVEKYIKLYVDMCSDFFYVTVGPELH